MKKVAIITGAGRGIGRSIAEKLNKEGFYTVLVDRSKKELGLVKKKFKSKSTFILCDISKEGEVVSMVSRVVKKFKKIDVLINNAGVSRYGWVDELTSKDIKETLEVNLGGTIYCTRETVKEMKRQKSGQIINICSIAAKFPEKFLSKSVYSASKAGLAVFGENISPELKKYNIKIANIFPALVATEGVKERVFWTQERLRYALFPEDIAFICLMIINQGKNSNISEVVVNNMYPGIFPKTENEERNRRETKKGKTA